MTMQQPTPEIIQRLHILSLNVTAIQQRYAQDLAALQAEIQALIPKENNRPRFEKGDFKRALKDNKRRK
jgi:hypothetical protein